MRSKLCTTIGIILVVVSAIGLLLAGGTLISLPSIANQLVEAIPYAKTNVAEAIAQARRKSYYGIAACTPILLLGVSLVRSQRRKKAAQQKSPMPEATSFNETHHQ